MVPEQPTQLSLAAYRPLGMDQPAAAKPLATVQVSDARAIHWLIEVVNSLTPRGIPPPRPYLPDRGAHDVLRFLYPDGTARTVRVARDGYRSVTFEGLPGSYAPTMPLYATIDSLLPASLREEIGNPTAYPPSKEPHYLSRDQAMARALCGTGPLPAEHLPADARLMTRQEAEALDPRMGHNAASHPCRKVWLVCIHVDVTPTRGLVGPPSPVHGCTLVIDAETGMVTDAGSGTAPLGKELCARCR